MDFNDVYYVLMINLFVFINKINKFIGLYQFCYLYYYRGLNYCMIKIFISFIFDK